jgi:hypothetical protein
VTLERLRLRRLIALLVLCVALLGATAASAATVTYAVGQTLVGGSTRSVGQAQRTAQYVYHTAGNSWCTRYSTAANGSDWTSLYCSTTNPTHDTRGIAYGYAWAYNVNDNSDFTWIAQSVNP